MLLNNYFTAQAYELDVSNVIMTIPNWKMYDGSFSVVFWWKPQNTYTLWNSILSNPIGSAPGQDFWAIRTYGPQLYLGSGDNSYSTTGYLQADTWTFLAFTYDISSTRRTTYVNSSLTYQVANGAARGLSASATSYTVLFADFLSFAVSEQKAVGTIQNLAIFSRELDAVTISSIFNAGRSFNLLNLVNPYDFVGYYWFRPGTLLSSDSSPAGRHLSSMYTDMRKSLYATASAYAKTTGTSSWISLIDRNFTVSLWVKKTSKTPSNWIQFVQWGSSGNGRARGVTLTGGGLIAAYTYYYDVFFNQSLNVGTWYHLAMVFGNGTGDARLYTNGVEISRWGVYANGTYPTVTTSDVYLGYGVVDRSPDPYVLIDEVSIFSRILTQTEVQSIYNNRNGDITTATKALANLVAYWKFDYAVSGGTTITDQSGNNRHLTLVNNPLIMGDVY